MATRYGVNADKVNVDNPSSKIAPGEQDGRVRVIYDEYDVANGALAAADVLNLGYLLPAGARVLEAKLDYTASLAATSDINFGWAASAGGEEAADDNGFDDAVDASSAGSASSAVGDAGYLKRFTAPVQPQLTIVTAGTPTSSGLIKMTLKYLRD